MTVHEKIKEMSFDEMIKFLTVLDADVDCVYCTKICEHRADGNCPLDDGELPCTDKVLNYKEFLSADYDIMQDFMR